MRRLLSQDLIRLWEAGLEQHPLDRALTILAAALPETPWDELADLSIGQRDHLLLAVREQTFGPRLAGVADCPACRARLEFVLNSSTLRTAPAIEPGKPIEQRTANGRVLRFRLPNSRDLAAILGYPDKASTRALLIQRCLEPACQAEGAAELMEYLTETGSLAVAAQMAERDPQAELQLDLRCPSCAHGWQIVFDIVSFFWVELCARAKRLLGEVHTLARAYGWREADILSLSAARRRAYLEMAT